MRLPLLCGSGIRDDTVRSDWMDIVSSCNENIKTYAGMYGTRMGTTVTALLITPVRYYILNVGDTRVYEIGDRVRKLTRDQTVTAREIGIGQHDRGGGREGFKKKRSAPVCRSFQGSISRYVLWRYEKTMQYICCAVTDSAMKLPRRRYSVISIPA